MTQIIPTSSSSLLLLLCTTSAATATAPVTWVQEKYLTQTYNDRDMCPDLHKPAIYFAMTGQQLWRVTPQRRHGRESKTGYTPPTAYDIRWIEITVLDVVSFLLVFIQYCCELLILLLSLLMLSLTTLILGILVFGQY